MERAIIYLKRIYEPPSREDGTRILIERLWPRGLTKEGAAVDLWLKEIAPSHELRKWYGHDPAKWGEFRERYTKELKSNTDAVGKLRELLLQGPATLVYAASDEEHNSALVLKEFMGRGKG